MLAACPLPYDYNGKSAGASQTADPSSPKLTSAVTVSYAEQGGTTGTIAEGDSFASGQDDDSDVVQRDQQLGHLLH